MALSKLLQFQVENGVTEFMKNRIYTKIVYIKLL